MDWTRILACTTGTVDQELLLRNEYLAAENRILRAQLNGCLRPSDAERATLEPEIPLSAPRCRSCSATQLGVRLPVRIRNRERAVSLLRARRIRGQLSSAFLALSRP
jgi:hypothetical protein